MNNAPRPEKRKTPMLYTKHLYSRTTWSQQQAPSPRTQNKRHKRCRDIYIL